MVDEKLINALRSWHTYEHRSTAGVGRVGGGVPRRLATLFEAQDIAAQAWNNLADVGDNYGFQSEEFEAASQQWIEAARAVCALLPPEQAQTSRGDLIPVAGWGGQGLPGGPGQAWAMQQGGGGGGGQRIVLAPDESDPGQVVSIQQGDDGGWAPQPPAQQRRIILRRRAQRQPQPQQQRIVLFRR